jgi:hypothetical protein
LLAGLSRHVKLFGMSHSKRKLKIGQSIGSGEKHADPVEERRRENMQFVIWTMVVPVVLMAILVLLWMLHVIG